MTTNAEALRQLRESRDGEPARVWHDSGRSVGRLARLAGVKVVWLHCDLTTGETVYREFNPAKEQNLAVRDVPRGAVQP